MKKSFEFCQARLIRFLFTGVYKFVRFIAINVNGSVITISIYHYLK